VRSIGTMALDELISDTLARAPTLRCAIGLLESTDHANRRIMSSSFAGHSRENFSVTRSHLAHEHSDAKTSQQQEVISLTSIRRETSQ